MTDGRGVGTRKVGGLDTLYFKTTDWVGVIKNVSGLDSMKNQCVKVGEAGICRGDDQSTGLKPSESGSRHCQDISVSDTEESRTDDIIM